MDKNKSLKIKLCGFKDKETVDFACKFDINFIGFVFHDSSPRNVDINNIAKIVVDIPSHINKVAVIVDASNDRISEIVKELKPDYLQLHGDESVDRVKEIKNLFQIPIIKAFRVFNKKDLEQIEDFNDVADYFLFDAKADSQKGGTGQKFDWFLLHGFKSDKEWFLSGGINGGNLNSALHITNAKIVDLSSAIEEIRGVKSKKLIKNFVDTVKKLAF